MRRSEYGPLQWSLASPAPGVAEKFRRRNTVLIGILAFLVLGAFVAAEAPHTGSSPSNAAANQTANPAATQHANSVKTAQPELHNRERSGIFNNLKKYLEGGHHSG